MSLVLCGEYALEIMRVMTRDGLMGRPWEHELSASACRRVLDDSSARESDVERLIAPELLALGAPQLLVPDRTRTHDYRGHEAHVWNRPVPAGMLWSTPDPEVYITCPALVMLGIVRTYGIVEASLVGLELCGTFARIDDLPERPPLTTPEEMGTILDAVGIGRFASVRAALSCVACGSRSPMESRSYLMVAGSRKVGGRHLPAPEMNPEIPLSGEATIFMGEQKLRCDLLWREAKLAVEYDSWDHHFDDPGLERTYDRKLVLEGMGYRVISFVRGDFNTYHKICYKLDELQRALGVRRSPRSKREIEREIGLHNKLGRIRVA